MKNKQHIVASICYIMRMTLAQIIILFITMGSLAANEANGQEVLNKKFSLDIKNKPLGELIRLIQGQTDVSFSYSESAVEASKLYSLSAKNESIAFFLEHILSSQNIGYKVIDEKIVLFKNNTKEVNAYPVTGRVLNEDNVPIAGASISVKGSNQSVSTDATGRFKMEVPGMNSILVISYVGFDRLEIQAKDVNNTDVVLRSAVTELDNVVVTALGVKRKERALGYSTQSVNGSSLQTVKGVDVATSLTGKVAGMIVKNSSEFAQAPELTIRGESPLIVVDGVPYGNLTLRDIPQDDIQSIDFLKGPTASALYGERGGAGAVMITTYKGAFNEGVEVSFNSSSMFEAGYLAIPKMQSTYGRVVNTATNAYVRSGDGSWGPALEGQDVMQWDPISKSMQLMPYTARGKDNFNNFLEPGRILNNNLGIAYRGEYGGLRASATWVNNKGTYPNSKFDKLTYSLAGDLNFNKVSITSSLSYNKHQSPNLGFGGYTGYDPMYSLLIWGSPDWNVLDYKDYWLIPNEQQNNSYTAGNNNPYFDRYQRIRPYDKDVFNGQLTLNYEIFKSLKATIRTGYDTYSDKQVVQISQGSFQGGGNSRVMNRGGTEIWGESIRGSFNTGLSRGFSTNTEAIITGETSVNDFQFDGFVGGSIYYKEDEGIEARTQGGLSVPAYYSLKSSVNPAAVMSVNWKKQTNSVFGKIGASYKNLAFLEATFRNDWTSTLPAETRSYFYPSVSASFIASDVLPKYDWLSIWKLRSNWTVAKGTPNIYEINNVYNIATNQWNGLPTATYPTAIRPSDVYSFASTSLEFGTQIGLFNRKVVADVTYFKKKIYDPLRMAAISEASGFSNVYINTKDETERRGWEVSLNYTPIKNENVVWNIGANWSKYANYYVKIDPEYAVQGRSWIAEGKRTDHYAINDYQTDNLGNVVMNNGVPTYKSILSLAGYSDPDWTWGINTTVSYKKLTLGLAFDGRVGGLAQSVTEMYMWRSGNHPNSVTEERYLDSKNPGTKNYLADGVKVVSGSIEYDVNGNVANDNRVFANNDIPTTYKSYLEALHKGTAWGGNPSAVDLYSTTFFKLREVSIGYDLPKNVYTKIGAKRLSVSLIGQNLIYWAKQFKYSDIDGGTENFADPSLRYIGFNVRVGF